MVQKDLKKYGIKKPKDLCIEAYGTTKYIDRDLLYDYYINKNFTTDECAEIFHVHNKTIRRRLTKFNIKKPIKLQKQA